MFLVERPLLDAKRDEQEVDAAVAVGQVGRVHEGPARDCPFVVLGDSIALEWDLFLYCCNMARV